jgi:hypothetical protein
MTDEAWIAVVALGLSILGLIWRLRDERVSYLQIGLTMLSSPVERFAIARLTIKNESVRIKRLSTAFLVVGPIAEDPVHTFNAVVGRTSGEQACCAIDFERLVPDQVLTDADAVRQIIVLPYFTEENDNVGDEELAYSLPIDLAALRSGLVLSVRFYVYGCKRARQNYHRKVHDILIVPPAADEEGRLACPTGAKSGDASPSAGVQRPAAAPRQPIPTCGQRRH